MSTRAMSRDPSLRYEFVEEIGRGFLSVGSRYA